eukprot:scaffold69281_cov26-Tisochrysis_lutea.AAC.1
MRRSIFATTLGLSNCLSEASRPLASASSWSLSTASSMFVTWGLPERSAENTAHTTPLKRVACGADRLTYSSVSSRAPVLAPALPLSLSLGEGHRAAFSASHAAASIGMSATKAERVTSITSGVLPPP